MQADLAPTDMHHWQIPLLPDPDEARRWLEAELADPAYDAAQPTPFDRAARAVIEFVNGLFSVDPGAVDPVGAIIIVAIVVVVLVAVAVLIWGLPRLRARSADTGLALFDADDHRTAAQLRADAVARAGAGDFAGAIVLRFRAIAAGLAERGATSPSPGATVHRFADEATRAFPGQRTELAQAAARFDDVRYLRQPGTEAGYQQMVALDDLLAATRPAALTSIGATQ